jgi:hypothetical protein
LPTTAALLLRLLCCQRPHEAQVWVSNPTVAQLHAHAKGIVRKQQQEEAKQRKADDCRRLAADAAAHVKAVAIALPVRCTQGACRLVSSQ